MNIAFLSYYSGLVARGVETYVHELANHLTDLGVTVDVYQGGPTLPQARYHTSHLSSVQVLPKFINLPDVLIPTNGRVQTALSKLWAIKSGKKILVSGQSGPGLDDRINLYCFPDLFVGLTNYQTSWAKNINPFTTTTTIPNGVDLQRFNPRVKPLQIDLPRPIILYVAALVPNKRQELLIQAAANLSASVLLVGQGSEQNRLTNLGLSVLGSRFKILSLPHDQIPHVYTACDVFTFPTVPWESFGISIVEAMACGLPVVAPDDPIRREIVGQAGKFIDPINISDYSAALTLSLNTDWKDLPHNEAQKYSWNIIAKEYLSALLKITSSN